MRTLPVILALAIALLAPYACAQGAVILVIDGLGSSYLAGHTAAYANGGTIDPIDMASFDGADAHYQLKVPVPATEYGHAVIVTGDSYILPEEVANYHATIFDALKDDGYVALGILENGDSKQMLAELDACVREKNDSVYSPYYEYVQNGNAVPGDIAEFLKSYPRLPKTKAGKDPYAAYIRYNAWGLGFARGLVEHINTSEPGLDYVLIVNVGGLDSAGQNQGYDGYKAVLSGMDGDLARLVEACRSSGTILLITGDHGMSFPDSAKKGSHANAAVSSRNESLLAPLFIYANVSAAGGGTYGQECLAPTLLSLLDEPDTLSMGDGVPLPVKDHPTLFLMSGQPVSVTITGHGINETTTFNGTYRIEGLEKGNYTIEYGQNRKAIPLDYDMLVELRDDGQSPRPVSTWMAILAVAAASAAGIGIALRLVRPRK